MKKQWLRNAVCIGTGASLLAGSFAMSSIAFATESQKQLSAQDLFPNRQAIEKLEAKWQAEAQAKQDRRALRGHVLTIDTRDREACAKVERELNLDVPICNDPNADPRKPFVSIFQITDISHKEYLDSRGQEYQVNEFSIDGIKDGKLNDKGKALLKDNGYVLLLGAAVFGTLIAMPPSVSKWDTENKAEFVKSMPSKWNRNVRSGPVVDKDEWMINYVGHPVSGAIYYQIARNEGFNWWQSFGYSVFMSTFFWEYGVEGLAEIPSIQDLVITPLIGSLMGEVFYQGTSAIDRNGGMIFGQKWLGTTVKILLNPGGMAINGLDHLFKGIKERTGLEGYSSVAGYPMQDVDGQRNYYVGMQLNFRFK